MASTNASQFSERPFLVLEVMDDMCRITGLLYSLNIAFALASSAAVTNNCTFLFLDLYIKNIAYYFHSAFFIENIRIDAPVMKSFKFGQPEAVQKIFYGISSEKEVLRTLST